MSGPSHLMLAALCASLVAGCGKLRFESRSPLDGATPVADGAAASDGGTGDAPSPVTDGAVAMDAPGGGDGAALDGSGSDDGAVAQDGPGDCTPVGPVRITSEAGESRAPDIDWNGSSSWIAWANTPAAGGTAWQTRTAEVALDGTILTPMRNASSGADRAMTPSVVTHAGGHTVAWVDLRTGSSLTYYAAFDTAGQKLTADVPMATGGAPFLVSTGNLVAMLFGVQLARVDFGGTDLGTTTTGLTSAGTSRAIAWKGTELAIVAAAFDAVAMDNALMFARYDEAASPIGAPVRLHNQPTPQTGSALAWNGTEYGLVSVQGSTVTAAIHYQRLAADGTPQITPVVLAPMTNFNNYPDMAAREGAFAITYVDGTVTPTEALFMEVTPDGTVLRPAAPLRFGAGEARAPTVVWTGTAYAVAWQEVADGSAEIFYATLCP